MIQGVECWTRSAAGASKHAMTVELLHSEIRDDLEAFQAYNAANPLHWARGDPATHAAQVMAYRHENAQKLQRIQTAYEANPAQLWYLKRFLEPLSPAQQQKVVAMDQHKAEWQTYGLSLCISKPLLGNLANWLRLISPCSCI